MELVTNTFPREKWRTVEHVRLPFSWMVKRSPCRQEPAFLCLLE